MAHTREEFGSGSGRFDSAGVFYERLEDLFGPDLKDLMRPLTPEDATAFDTLLIQAGSSTLYPIDSISRFALACVFKPVEEAFTFLPKDFTDRNEALRIALLATLFAGKTAPFRALLERDPTFATTASFSTSWAS